MQRLKGHFLAVPVMLMIGLSVGGNAEAAVVTATWIGVTGDWRDPANWAPRVIPDNGADQYDVRIDDNPDRYATVNLTGLPVVVNHVTVDAGDTLNVGLARNSTGLHVDGSNLRNAGVLTIDGASTLLITKAARADGRYIDTSGSTFISDGLMVVEGFEKFGGATSVDGAKSSLIVKGDFEQFKGSLSVGNRGKAVVESDFTTQDVSVLIGDDSGSSMTVHGVYHQTTGSTAITAGTLKIIGNQETNLINEDSRIMISAAKIADLPVLDVTGQVTNSGDMTIEGAGARFIARDKSNHPRAPWPLGIYDQIGGTTTVRNHASMDLFRYVQHDGHTLLDGGNIKARGTNSLRILGGSFESRGGSVETKGNDLEFVIHRDATFTATAGLTHIEGGMQNIGQATINADARLTTLWSFFNGPGWTTDRRFRSQLFVNGSLRTGEKFHNTWWGRVQGNGLINGKTFNEGDFRPRRSQHTRLDETSGADDDAPGMLTIQGDYSQYAQGSLSISLAGTEFLPAADLFEYARLQVDGAAILETGTTFNIALVDGFLPSVGDVFDILTAGRLEDLVGNALHAADISRFRFHGLYNPSTPLLQLTPSFVDLDGDARYDTLRLSASVPTPAPAVLILVSVTVLGLFRSSRRLCKKGRLMEAPFIGAALSP